MRIDSLITRLSKNTVRDHFALSIQVVVWVMLAQSDSFPEWFYLVSLTVIVVLLTIMHFLCRASVNLSNT